MQPIRQILLAAISLLVFTPADALAAEAQPYLSVTDPSPKVIPLMDTNDNMLFRVEANRSYCCEAYRQSPMSSFDGASEARITQAFSFNETTTLTTDVTNVKRGLCSPVVPFSLRNGSSPAEPEATRLCFTTVSSEVHGCVLRFGTAGVSNVTNIAVQVRETTLFGGFNTSVTDFNFLEIRNVSNQSILAKINAVDTISGLAAITDLAVTIPAGQRVDVDIHSRTGAGKFGPVVITHDGPYGSLQVQLSQYNIVSTSPLDFAPVAVELFRPR